MLNLSIPEHIEPLRNKVLNFIEQEVYPVEVELQSDKVGSRRGDIMRGLMDKADPAVIEAAAVRLENARMPSWIDLHGLRSWSSGARTLLWRCCSKCHSVGDQPCPGSHPARIRACFRLN